MIQIFLPWENICHHVEQIFLNNIFFGCEILTEPTYLATQKTEKLPTLAVKKVQIDQSWLLLKKLPTLVLYLTAKGEISMKFYSKWKQFHSSKCICQCCRLSSPGIVIFYWCAVCLSQLWICSSLIASKQGSNLHIKVLKLATLNSVLNMIYKETFAGPKSILPVIVHQPAINAKTGIIHTLNDSW